MSSAIPQACCATKDAHIFKLQESVRNLQDELSFQRETIDGLQAKLQAASHR